MYSFLPTRRHRMFTLALAVIAAGTFFIFITGVLPLGEPEQPLRTCGLSEMYQDAHDEILPFDETRRMYHYVMEQLIEERMRLYEGRILLQCSGENMEEIVPPGEFASIVAGHLPHVPDSPNFTYAYFDQLLYEFWRTYDCHLFAIQTAENVALERERARRTYDRLLTVLRSSEQYLPLHASLRCLQRASSDVRNAFGIISDASQCLPARLAQPTNSLLP